MATTEVTKRRVPASRSSVVMKYAMAVSGLIMVGFLLMHMYGNLKVFAGQEAFDHYAEHLRTIGEPILPHKGFLWIFRVVMLAAVFTHFGSAFHLWAKNKKAAGYTGGRRYLSKQNKRGVQRSYASFTMRWGGVIILLFIIFHLLNLTTGTIHPGGSSDSPYQRVVNTFGAWYIVVWYSIALLAVGFHIWHGFWSAFTTLGANHANTRLASKLTPLAAIIAGVITVGFLLPPWAVLFGIVS